MPVLYTFNRFFSTVFRGVRVQLLSWFHLFSSFLKYPKCALCFQTIVCVFRLFSAYFVPANVLFQLFFKLPLTPLSIVRKILTGNTPQLPFPCMPPMNMRLFTFWPYQLCILILKYTLFVAILLLNWIAVQYYSTQMTMNIVNMYSYLLMLFW